jgi:hypothetical protein
VRHKPATSTPQGTRADSLCLRRRVEPSPGPLDSRANGAVQAVMHETAISTYSKKKSRQTRM